MWYSYMVGTYFHLVRRNSDVRPGEGECMKGEL